MASVTFNDGTGRTLTNSASVALATRFANWLAQPVVVGPVRFSLATGARYVWEHRTDWKVSFSITLLQDADLETAQYLIRHLQRGGNCALNTGDIAARSYTAFLGEGDDVQLTGPEGELGEYTLTARLTTTATTPPLCVY